MTSLNPYASFVGASDPLRLLAATASELGGLIDGLSPSQIDQRPSPDKWSLREILCHLADTEMVFAFRLRQTLAQPDHIIQPFDQEIWAERYAAYDAQAALAMFDSTRQWNLRLLSKVTEEEWSKSVTHPERGEMTFRTIVETMAGHDGNHLRQVHALSAAMHG